MVMKARITMGIFLFLLIIPSLVSATCDLNHQTYVYKSAVFYVADAERIRVTVTNPMGDVYPRCYTAWIYLNGKYVNLDGLPYSPNDWQQAWVSTAPSCSNSGYRVTSPYGSTAEYDLTRFTGGKPYTGRIEVRVSSYCYELQTNDPCFCWNVDVEVVKPRYCQVTVKVKDETSGQPISNARVCWDQVSWDDPCVYTDGSGVARFNLPLGTHTVTIFASGYQTKTITVNCDSCGNDIYKTVYLARLQPSCSVEVNDVILERIDVTYDDPQSFCLGDRIRVCADVSFTQYVDDPTVTLDMYVDGNYYDSEYVTFTNSGSRMVCFDKTLDTLDLGDGSHVVKILASVPCDPDGDSMAKHFVVRNCAPYCNLEIVDSEISKSEVKAGESFDVWVKMRMDYSNANDAYAYVTVSVEYADDASQTKNFYFNYPGDTDGHYFTFDTTGWQPGTYYVYVTAEGEYGCTLQRTYIGSVRVKPYPETDISIGKLSVNPSSVCVYEDREVRLKVPVTLEEDSDNTRVEANFYVKSNDGWVHVDRVVHYLNRGETRTFTGYYDYESYELSVGYHEVKVVVRADGDVESDKAELYVSSCRPSPDVSIGSIRLVPSEPRENDKVKVYVPIKLLRRRHTTEEVFVKAYVDDKLVDETKVVLYYVGDEKTAKFEFNAWEFGRGNHEIRVKATVDSRVKTRTKFFTIGAFPTRRHCLSIQNVKLLDEPVAGKDVRVGVEVENCGDFYETNVKTRIRGFGKVFYGGKVGIGRGSRKEVVVTVEIPDGIREEVLEIKVWNAYTSATGRYKLIVGESVPYIDIEPEYRVYTGKHARIEFFVENVGDATGTFKINVSGEAKDWITGLPEKVTLKPKERMKISATVKVPKDVKEGYYDFTVTAKDHYTKATSSLHVVKPFELPKFPTGMFASVRRGLLTLFPCLILILILLCLLFLLFLLRKKPREEMFKFRTFDC